jgi:RNA polymerase sporulation-specific sigma factor
MTAQEEQDCLRRAEAGDEGARSALIERNLRLVAHIAKKYFNQGGDQEDLISIGTIGLIKAVNTFRSDKNIRLATYASRCIENEILMHLRRLRRRGSECSLNDALEQEDEGLSLQDVLRVEDTMLEDLSVQEDCGRLREAVDRCLTGRERTVILCLHVQQMASGRKRQDCARRRILQRSAEFPVNGYARTFRLPRHVEPQWNIVGSGQH